MFETILAITIGAALMWAGVQIGHQQERESQKHTDRLISGRTPR